MCSPEKSPRKSPLLSEVTFVTGALIDHLLLIIPLTDVALLLRDLCSRLNHFVSVTLKEADAAMMQALGGNGVRTSVTDSCIRRAFQARGRALSCVRVVLTARSLPQERWQLMLELKADAGPPAVKRLLTDSTAHLPQMCGNVSLDAAAMHLTAPPACAPAGRRWSGMRTSATP
jgi:hypothetical protein